MSIPIDNPEERLRFSIDVTPDQRAMLQRIPKGLRALVIKSLVDILGDYINAGDLYEQAGKLVNKKVYLKEKSNDA